MVKTIAPRMRLCIRHYPRPDRRLDAPHLVGPLVPPDDQVRADDGVPQRPHANPTGILVAIGLAVDRRGLNFASVVLAHWDARLLPAQTHRPVTEGDELVG